MKHLKENKLGYWKHWSVATRAGIALLIHAWFPDILPDYASKLICPNKKQK